MQVTELPATLIFANMAVPCIRVMLSTMLSTVENFNVNNLPSNRLQVTASLTDAPVGKDRLSITVLLPSSFGLVRSGEQ